MKKTLHILIWGGIFTIIYVGLVNSKILNPSSDELLSKNVSLLEDKGLNYSSEVIANSEIILRKSPLSDMALVHIYQAKKMANPVHRESVNLIQAAAIRNPRNRNVISESLLIAANEGNIPMMIDELDILYRLDGDKIGPEIIQSLSNFFELEVGRKAIESKTKDGLPWAYILFHDKIKNSTPESILNLEYGVNQLILSKKNPRFNHKLIQRYATYLLIHKQYKKSFDFWTRQSADGLDLDSMEPGLLNSNFERTDLNPPFNWALTKSSEVSAELELGGGLFIHFGGKERRVAARQVFKWPEHHSSKLKLQASYAYRKDVGNFSVAINCLSPRKLIKIVTLEHQNKDKKNHSFDISDEAFDCEMAQFDIIANPGVYSRPISISIQSADIEFLPEPSSKMAEELQ